MSSMTLVVASVLWLAPADAPTQLRWEAPAGCPDAAFVRERFDAYVAERGAVSDGTQAAGVVRRRGAAWQLSLTIHDSDGEVETRELTDVDCDGLAESAAVLAALAMTTGQAEPPASSDPRPSDPERAVAGDEPNASREEALEPVPATATATGSKLPLSWSGRVSAGASIGWLPLGADVGVTLALARHVWRVEVSGIYALRRQVRFPDVQSAGANLSAWSVGVHGCGVLRVPSRVTFPLCLGGEAGQALARPIELADGRAAGVAWAGLTASPKVRIEAHTRVSLWLEPELVLTLVRPRLEVGGQSSPLFESAPASVRLRFGVEVRFW